MTAKTIALLGMARKAGKIGSGESQVEAYLKKKKGYLLIIAKDALGATIKYSRWANDINIPVLIEGSKQELGLAIGLSPRSIILVTDRGFAEAIFKENNTRS